MPNIANRILGKQHTSDGMRSARESVNIGEGVYLPRDSILDAKKITIGDHTRINGKIQIIASGEATIGKYCAIGRDVLIITSNHAVFRASVQLALYLRMFKHDNIETRGPLEIGSDAWIGDRVIMVPGARIRDGCVIGAGSVVTKEIPPYSIAVGVPAKVIRPRFPEGIVRQLLQIRWWDWKEDRIKRNREFFLADLRDSTLDLNSLIKE